MNKMKTITLSILLAVLLLLSMDMTASAQATRTYLASYEYDCMVDPGTMWLEGDILHVRGRVQSNVNVSDAPELNGISTVVGNADINLKTGYGVFRGTYSFQPNDIAGTWEGSWIFTGTKGTGVSRTVAQGTGALAGKKLFLTMRDDLSPGDESAAMCANLGEWSGNIVAEGYILDPGGP